MDRGLRLSDVAERAGVSTQYLSEVERGRKEASSEVLGAVTEALGSSLADLARGVADGLAPDERRRERSVRSELRGRWAPAERRRGRPVHDELRERRVPDEWLGPDERRRERSVRSELLEGSEHDERNRERSVRDELRDELAPDERPRPDEQRRERSARGVVLVLRSAPSAHLGSSGSAGRVAGTTGRSSGSAGSVARAAGRSSGTHNREELLLAA